jgi:hypothetical protein
MAQLIRINERLGIVFERRDSSLSDLMPISPWKSIHCVHLSKTSLDSWLIEANQIYFLPENWQLFIRLKGVKIADLVAQRTKKGKSFSFLKFGGRLIELPQKILGDSLAGFYFLFQKRNKSLVIFIWQELKSRKDEYQEIEILAREIAFNDISKDNQK